MVDGSDQQYHIKLKSGESAPYVIVPGDPGRVPLIASFLDDAQEVAYNREYCTYRGHYKGVDISVTSTGIGGPSAAIAIEELAKVGAQVMIRAQQIMSAFQASASAQLVQAALVTLHA